MRTFEGHGSLVSALAILPDGRRARACGLVVGRQRPGAARGTIFVTLEDETGQVNMIVWPSAYADRAQRQALLRARLLQVDGQWQRDDSGAAPVCHLVARGFQDLTPLLGPLAERVSSRDFH